MITAHDIDDQQLVGGIQLPFFITIEPGFDSNSLTAANIATKNDHYYWNSQEKLCPSYLISYKSCLPIYRIVIIRSLSFLVRDDFEGNANISVTIKSGSTVSGGPHSSIRLKDTYGTSIDSS